VGNHLLADAAPGFNRGGSAEATRNTAAAAEGGSGAAVQLSKLAMPFSL
jgi:hypothetical protein